MREVKFQRQFCDRYLSPVSKLLPSCPHLFSRYPTTPPTLRGSPLQIRGFLEPVQFGDREVSE